MFSTSRPSSSSPATSTIRSAVASLHAALWNQGLASLLVVVCGDTVRVFTLARIPRAGDKRDFHDRCLVRTLDLVDDALALRNLVYATESGRFWEEKGNRNYFDPRERVDRVLLGQPHGVASAAVPI